MAELGFIEGGKNSITRYSTMPHLNVQPEYTHVVSDGATQVARGGIECALDGGTLDIAMYDITDGVVGEAPRVFSQTITLPESPLADGEGYELGTHVFELDAVSLRTYVDRELAVAVVHNSERAWGNHRYSPGAPYSRGGSGAPLADPWEGGKKEGYATRSAALFVEPVDVPDEKARTVTESPIFGDRSQTVFAAFPDLSPQGGMVLEYDARTTAGARVTVLPNGGIRVGQGSSPTDSFEVRLRDTDGTWHGPKPITLTVE